MYTGCWIPKAAFVLPILTYNVVSSHISLREYSDEWKQNIRAMLERVRRPLQFFVESNTPDSA